jgi:predicted nucleic-acid-binding protein
MTPDLTILDTNAVLRFLLRDIEEQALVAKERIALTECRIPAEVIAEVVYVLSGVYGIDRTAIADKIEELIAVKDGLVEKSSVVSFAGRLYAENVKLDFVDCLLAGYHAVTGCSIFTFDKDLQKQLVRQHENES